MSHLCVTYHYSLTTVYSMMSHVYQVDCVDRSLHDIIKIEKPFGGITVVFGGDPHQILPVVCHGN